MTAGAAEVVRAAAERVAPGYREGILLVPEERSLTQELARVVEAVEAALDGEEAPAPRSGSADPLELLRALRTEVVRDWPVDLPLLPVMEAFEDVQARILARRDTVTDDVVVPTARGLLREVAHMLRSPLGSIVLLADTLREQGADLPPDRRNKQLGIIHNAALGLASTAGDLLTLIDEETGLGPLGTFSPAEVLGVVTDIVRPVAEVRGCRLEVTEATSAVVQGHATALTRVLLSITLRVIRRMRDGALELSAASESGRLRFAVRGRDGGAAPEGVQPALFEVFRLDDPLEKSYTLSAEGLGLVTAARLIQEMGSELRVETGADGGLELTFSLNAP